MVELRQLYQVRCNDSMYDLDIGRFYVSLRLGVDDF